MKSSRKDHFFIYPKTVSGKHTGHVFCIVLRDGMMFQGEALCNPEDRFVKATGKQISFMRALQAHQDYMDTCEANKGKK